MAGCPMRWAQSWRGRTRRPRLWWGTSSLTIRPPASATFRRRWDSWPARVSRYRHVAEGERRTKRTATNRRITWKASKYRVMSSLPASVSITPYPYNLSNLPMPHPITMINGSTNSAICMLDPTATPMARSILSLHATVTAVACSAALPTIGRRINPTKVSEMWPCVVSASIEST